MQHSNFSSDIISRRAISKEIKAQIEIFLANGGKIQQVAYGVTADANSRVPPTTKANKAESKNGRNLNSSASTDI